MKRLAACLLLLATMSPAFAVDDIDARLLRADEIKRSQGAVFAAELDALEAADARLSPRQRQFLAYLRGWQATYAGQYGDAAARFSALLREAEDPLIRFRSRATLLNALTLSRRYAEGFDQLNLLLGEIDTVTDPGARAQALGVSAQLLNQVGKYGESLRYSTELLQESKLPWARCGAAQLEFEARFKSGELTDVSPQLERWADECALQGEGIFAGLLRTYVSRLHLQNGRHAEAINTLEAHRAELSAARYPFLNSDVASILATAQLALGQLDAAASNARTAIDQISAGVYTESLTEAWRVLYQVALKRGDLQQAVEALERYREVELAYLDDVGRRALAYEMARHEARAKSLQIESLNRQNQVLQLQQQVAEKNVAMARLSIVLLLTILVFAVVWALRTRRMQRHFQQLAQCDSLTAVASRLHFMEQASVALEQLARADKPAALVVIDLDYFKSVNDRFGHAAGDDVLQRAAFACGELLAPDQLFGRLGGEEFGILVPGSIAHAMELAERCRLALLEIHFGVEDQLTRLSGSFGVAGTETCGHDLRRLMTDADTALYEAKRKGRNRVVCHVPALDAAARLRVIA